MALVWLAACGDDETVVATSATTSSSATGGMGGESASSTGGGASGGSGAGTVGTCPTDEQSTDDTCESIDLLCDYGDVCCRCTNISCAVVWECVDPTGNDAACPTAVPPENLDCTGTLSCSYCTSEGPLVRTCEGDVWVTSDIATCPD